MESKIICLNCQNTNWRKDFRPISLHPVTLLQHAMCPNCVEKFDTCPSCHSSIETRPFEMDVIMRAFAQSEEGDQKQNLVQKKVLNSNIFIGNLHIKI